MIDWWGPVLMEFYSGSEATGVTLSTTEDWLNHPGTVGRSLTGPIVIADDDGRELPPGQIGGVYFDSGAQFEYRNDPERPPPPICGPVVRPLATSAGSMRTAICFWPTARPTRSFPAA